MHVWFTSFKAPKMSSPLESHFSNCLVQYTLHVPHHHCSAVGRECGLVDYAPLIHAVQNGVDLLPMTPTAQQLLSACSYSNCIEWFSQVATLSCTVNGVLTTVFDNLCRNAGPSALTPPPSGGATTSPPSLRLTASPPSLSTGPCASSDFATVPPLRKQYAQYHQPLHGSPSGACTLRAFSRSKRMSSSLA
ncbi:Aste57867_13791 [Aphanomyces stellatus]|uniref:Aste57867_13791 protein n=1 Tax=Aphanomyces stellatus TaxID=120398 RepID=A0A485KZL0_9STRA|nr:hypothetical protein As57867_013741 [Aphanomyces stellatus]VFT90623.1 Aste57867_13791 [Aphanomyces stellatus]